MSAAWHGALRAGGIAIPGFAPSHLNEHKLLGQPVEVFYRREGDALVLRNITD